MRFLPIAISFLSSCSLVFGSNGEEENELVFEDGDPCSSKIGSLLNDDFSNPDDTPLSFYTSQSNTTPAVRIAEGLLSVGSVSEEIRGAHGAQGTDGGYNLENDRAFVSVRPASNFTDDSIAQFIFANREIDFDFRIEVKRNRVRFGKQMGSTFVDLGGAIADYNPVDHRVWQLTFDGMDLIASLGKSPSEPSITWRYRVQSQEERELLNDGNINLALFINNAGRSGIVQFDNLNIDDSCTDDE